MLYNKAKDKAFQAYLAWLITWLAAKKRELLALSVQSINLKSLLYNKCNSILKP